MRGLLGIPAAILTTAFCWGTYGTILFWGTQQMGGSRMRPFICLGIAYFVLAVALPTLYLKFNGEKGNWTSSGVLWSFIAGCAGAVGALGIILSTAFGGLGSPVYVMPIVFGGAPVINTLTTMMMTRNFKVSPMFLAGLILVIAGAAMVLIFKPESQKPLDHTFLEWVKIITSIALTIICWGAYGPILHKGQLAMNGSRMRPFICVGWAYVVVAVILPLVLIPILTFENTETVKWTTNGVLWSLFGGSLGAIGALGIIMAFTLGGKPVYVMPMVFGGAPIVNTFFGLATAHGAITSVHPAFYSGLIMAIIGAAMVLMFAPKGHPVPKPNSSMSAKVGAAAGGVVGAAVTGTLSATGAAINAMRGNSDEKKEEKPGEKPNEKS